MKKLFLIVLVLSFKWVVAQPALQEEQDFEFSKQLLNKGMYDLAAVQFTRFVDNYPASLKAPNALMLAGDCYEQLDSLSRAASCYFDLLLKYPQSEMADQAILKRGKILYKNREYSNAAASLERLYVFAPSSPLVPEAQLLAAQAWYDSKSYSKALDAVNVIIERYSDSPLRPQAHLLLAQIRAKQGQINLAFNELDKITGNSLESEITQQALLAKAKLYEESGRFSLSDSLLAQIIKSNTLSEYVSRAGLRLALSKQSFGDYAGSNTILSQLMAKQATGYYAARYHLSMGDNEYAQGRYDAAMQQYTASNPAALDDAWRHARGFRLGMASGKLEKYLDADQYFSGLLQSIETDTILACYALLSQADILAKSDRSLDAVNMLQRSLENQKYAEIKDEILNKIGQIRESGLSDYTGARNSYAAIQSAIMDSPLTDEAQAAIASSYIHEQEPKQALLASERFLSLYPASEYYEQMVSLTNVLRLQVPSDPAAGRMLPGMFENRSAAEWMTLARYYMDRIKDYQTALTILHQAMRMNSNESLDTQTWSYEKARCHAALARIYAFQHKPVLYNAQKDSVEQIFRFMKTNFPDIEQTWDILSQKIACDLQDINSPQIKQQYLDTTLVQYPEAQRDSVWYHYSLLHANAIMHSMVDSTNWLSLQKANLICGQILDTQLDPEVRDNTLLLTANILNRLAETDSALVLLGNLSHKSSYAGVHAQFLQAKILHAQGESNKARQLYSHIKANHAYSALGKESAIALVQILMDQGEPEAAQAILDKYRPLRRSPHLPAFFFNNDDAEWLWMAAKLAQFRQDDLTATEILRNYIHSSGTRTHHPEALLILGNIARDQHHNQIAQSHYNELMQRFPTDTLAQVAAINSAQIYYDMGDYATAGDIYKRIQNKLTGNLRIQAKAREINCLINTGNLAHAKQMAKEFSKTYDARKYEADFLYEEGLYHIRQKDFDLAEDALKTLGKKYDDIPEGGKGQLGLARMYVITGKPEEALEILTRIPDRYDDPVILATAYLNLGDFYYENRQLPQCISACEKVTELVDQGMLHKSALNLLIKTYDQYKFWDKAISLIREFIVKYPNDPDIMTKRIQIGTMLHDLKDYDRSISHLVQLKPLVTASEEPEVQYWIARSYLDKGDMEQAIVEFLKVKYLSKPTKLPWGVTALYEAGNAYYKLGNSVKAIELLEQVVRERGIQDNIGRAASERIKTIREETGQPSNG